jgi:hypothetical protein
VCVVSARITDDASTAPVVPSCGPALGWGLHWAERVGKEGKNMLLQAAQALCVGCLQEQLMMHLQH